MSPPSPLSPDPAAQRIEQRLTIVAIDGVVVGTRRGDRGAQPDHRRVAAQIRAGVAVIRQAEQHVRRPLPGPPFRPDAIARAAQPRRPALPPPSPATLTPPAAR